MASGRDVQHKTPLQSPGICSAPGHREERVSVKLTNILPWLADAASNGVGWLHDFEEEEVCLTADLYDVILAYQHFHHR